MKRADDIAVRKHCSVPSLFGRNSFYIIHLFYFCFLNHVENTHPQVNIFVEFFTHLPDHTINPILVLTLLKCFGNEHDCVCRFKEYYR